jgi:integrase
MVAAMPPRASGSIEPYAHADGRTVSYTLRVRSGGQRYRVTLGTNHQGWSEQRAQVELDEVLAQIARGTWQPPGREERDRAETIHLTASRWWQRRRTELAETTQADYRWRLDHVLRELARERTAELDARSVDEFRQALVGRGLSPRSVNMVLDLLAQILDDAVEYQLLDANPARGRRRRMKVPKGSRSFLEPDMVVDLLDVAGEWEREVPPHQRYGRRALLAALCLAGPRITELTDARRARLDIHGGGLVLGKKTAAGTDRHLDLTAFLLDELRGHLAGLPPDLRARAMRLPLFPSRTGGHLNASNIRNRLLAETVRRANEKRSAEGRMLLPDRVTPHTLRRTFASLCFFAGRDLRFVMGQLGHDDPRMTLAVYAQAMKRQRIDEALVWSLMRFPNEPEQHPRGRARGIDPRIDPKGAESLSDDPRNVEG